MSINGNPATGAQTSLFYIQETVCDEVPSNPTWLPLRYTGGIPALTREQLQSNELDGSREIIATRGGTQNASGDINVELSHLSHVDLISAALGSNFVAQPVIDVTSSSIAFAASNNQITATSSAFANVLPGRKITISGSNSNDGEFTVATVIDTNTVTVDESLTDESAGQSVSIDAPSVMSARVGRLVKTFSLLVVYNDLTTNPSYDIITGVEFTGFAVNLATNAIATATFNTIGRTYQANAQLPAGSTFADPTPSRPYTGLDGALKQDGELLAVVTSVTPTLNNNASPESSIGQRGIAYISRGRANNTFDIASAFTSYSLFQSFIDETQSRISLRLELDGNFLELNYPRVQFTSGSPNPEGEGTIVVTIGVQAIRDPSAGSSIVVSYNS